jgi:hypothetical protein
MTLPTVWGIRMPNSARSWLLKRFASSVPSNNRFDPTLSIVTNIFTHNDLPSDTIYIFDGTSMMYQAYYGKEAKSLDHAFFKEPFKRNILQHLPHIVREEGVRTDDVVSEKNYSIDSSAPLNCMALSAMLMNFARFIRDIKPNYVAVTFDAGKESFRNEMLPSYKKQRPKVGCHCIAHYTV